MPFPESEKLKWQLYDILKRDLYNKIRNQEYDVAKESLSKVVDFFSNKSIMGGIQTEIDFFMWCKAKGIACVPFMEVIEGGSPDFLCDLPIVFQYKRDSTVQLEPPEEPVFPLEDRIPWRNLSADRLVPIEVKGNIKGATNGFDDLRYKWKSNKLSESYRRLISSFGLVYLFPSTRYDKAYCLVPVMVNMDTNPHRLELTADVAISLVGDFKYGLRIKNTRYGNVPLAILMEG